MKLDEQLEKYVDELLGDSDRCGDRECEGGEPCGHITKSDLRQTLTSVYNQAVREERANVYRKLLSKEAHLSHLALGTEYDQGYFNAIDDLAKELTPPTEDKPQ